MPTSALPGADSGISASCRLLPEPHASGETLAFLLEWLPASHPGSDPQGPLSLFPKTPWSQQEGRRF